MIGQTISHYKITAKLGEGQTLKGKPEQGKSTLREAAQTGSKVAEALESTASLIENFRGIGR